MSAKVYSGVYICFLDNFWPDIAYIQPEVLEVDDTSVTLKISPWVDSMKTVNKTVQYRVRFYRENVKEIKWDNVGESSYATPTRIKKVGLMPGTKYRADVRLQLYAKSTRYYSAQYAYSAYSIDRDFTTTGDKPEESGCSYI